MNGSPAGLHDDKRPRRALAAAVLVLAVFVNWPTRLHDGRWEEGLRLAQRLIIVGRYDEANAWVERIEPRAPRPGATHHGAGAQLLVQNQPERALAHLTKAHALSPGDAQVGYALGKALLDAGRPQEAIPHLRRAFDAGIELPSGGYDYAAALQAAGDNAGAIGAIRRLRLPEDGIDPEPWLKAGRLASRAQAPDVAEAYFRRGAAIAPRLAAARQQLGLNLLVLGRTEEAARELAEAVRLDPRDPDSLAHLAYCELGLGRTADARMHVAAALAVDSDHPLARQLSRAVR